MYSIQETSWWVRRSATTPLLIVVAVLLFVTGPASSLSVSCQPSNISENKRCSGEATRYYSKAKSSGSVKLRQSRVFPFYLALSSLPSSSVELRGGGESLSIQLKSRIAADPNFVLKSVMEVALACGTQFFAELNRRGLGRMTPEIDFVIAGVLTAAAGKYYSMWRVAPTASLDVDEEEGNGGIKDLNSTTNARLDDGTSHKTSPFWSKVPTNAFQGSCLDGSRPTISLRLASFLVPMPSLFRAGIIASLVGYGSTAFFIHLRSRFMPSYMAQTQNISVIAASLYTGVFLALVSNLRYQLLQGIIEPRLVDRFFARWPPLHAVVVFVVRLGNGFLGSVLAIVGMRRLGLQKLK